MLRIRRKNLVEVKAKNKFTTTEMNNKMLQYVAIKSCMKPSFDDDSQHFKDRLNSSGF